MESSDTGIPGFTNDNDGGGGGGLIKMIVVVVLVVDVMIMFQGFYRKLPTSPGSPYRSFSLDANEALKVNQLIDKSVNQLSIKLIQ